MLGIIGCALFLLAAICFIHWVQLYGFVETREEISEARCKPEFQLSIVFGVGALVCIAVAAFGV